VPDVVSMAKALLQALGAAHDALETYSGGVDLKTLAERLLRAYISATIMSVSGGLPSFSARHGVWQLANADRVQAIGRRHR